jgi:hypothetical protein
MATTFNIKQNDTAPVIQGTAKTRAGAVIDITGATIRFHMNDSTGTNKVDAAGSVVDGPNGVMKYEWSAADTDTVGTFDGEFEVTYADSKIETFPNDGHITVVITDDLA